MARVDLSPLAQVDIREVIRYTRRRWGQGKVRTERRARLYVLGFRERKEQRPRGRPTRQRTRALGRTGAALAGARSNTPVLRPVLRWVSWCLTARRARARRAASS